MASEQMPCRTMMKVSSLSHNFIVTHGRAMLCRAHVFGT